MSATTPPGRSTAIAASPSPPRRRKARRSSRARGGTRTPRDRWSRWRPRSPSGLGLALGDEITVNVLGREITARIANLRRVDWRSYGINFVMVFSPDSFKGAPFPRCSPSPMTRPTPSASTGASRAKPRSAFRWPPDPRQGRAGGRRQDRRAIGARRALRGRDHRRHRHCSRSAAP